MATQMVGPFGSLEGKVVLVTGASSGIGREFCLDLSKSGCLVIAAARRMDQLESLCRQIHNLNPSNSGIRVVAVQLDVANDSKAIEASVQKAWDAFGRIDTLINNAGVRGKVRTCLDISENEWDNIMRTNVRGTWLVSKSVGIRMRDAKIEGSIINISSAIGVDRVLVPGGIAYVTSKAAMCTMTKVMALELGAYKIRVNAIAPSYFKSEITQGLFEKDGFQTYVNKTVPLKDLGTTDPALTSLIKYLMHDSSGYVTGNIYLVDSGFTLPGIPIYSSL